MKTLKVENQYQLCALNGEWLRRLKLNLNRMNTDEYSPVNVFKPLTYEWHGDWEGRTLLALSCLEELFGEDVVFSKDVWGKYVEHLNNGMYFGPVFDGASINEQQFAGNSWFLRSLCNEYEKSQDTKLYERIKTVVYELYIKASNRFLNYPIDFNVAENGGIIGELNVSFENWRISSDVGCLYISIDGLSHAYKIVKDPLLRGLIDKLIEMMNSTNVAEKNFQCHAFLSGIRGILRMGELIGEEYYKIAEELFAYYLKDNVNGVYEGSGVIGKPAPSEGCAVIDSAMIAIRLYLWNKNEKYLSLYRKILVNAIEVNQRSNGGFGCNKYVGKENPYLEILPEGKEAYWCCSMRGAEGLTDVVTHLYCAEEDVVELLTFADSEVLLWEGQTRIEQSTCYPRNGETVLKIKTKRPFRLRIRALGNYELQLNGKPFADEISVEIGESIWTLSMQAKKTEERFEGLFRYHLGDKVLCAKSEIVQGANELIPLTDFSLLSMDDLDTIKIRTLFNCPLK